VAKEERFEPSTNQCLAVPEQGPRHDAVHHRARRIVLSVSVHFPVVIFSLSIIATEREGMSLFSVSRDIGKQHGRGGHDCWYCGLSKLKSSYYRELPLFLLSGWQRIDLLLNSNVTMTGD
jgi:hypothetical protein